jgi:hypothetical protein
VVQCRCRVSRAVTALVGQSLTAGAALRCLDRGGAGGYYWAKGVAERDAGPAARRPELQLLQRPGIRRHSSSFLCPVRLRSKAQFFGREVYGRTGKEKER